MNVIHAASLVLLFLCFIVISTDAGSSNPPQLVGDVSINCGSAAGKSAAVRGKEWLGDAQPKSSSFLKIGGSSSTTSTAVDRKPIPGDGGVPYGTARISRSKFSYAFRVNPGQKILRLHFNPVPYKGFVGFKDLFTVEVGRFTLLGNFSASLTAQATGVNSIVKEFCLYLPQDEQLNVILNPANSSPSLSTYAFINGIEIISVPLSLSYFHGGDIGVQVVGEKSQVYVDYNTALELIHRSNVGKNSDSSYRESHHRFPVWATQKANKENNSTWRIPADVGFRYLIRLHFSGLGLKAMGSDDLIFKVLINEMVAHTNVDIGKGRGGNRFPCYMDYLVLVRGERKQVKREIVISLHSYDALVDIDGNGLLTEFEVFKLSNHIDSLVTPNPLPSPQDSPCFTIKTLLLLVLGNRYAPLNVLIIILSFVNVTGHKLREFCEASTLKEENKPSPRAQQVCRPFSLVEIQLATRNFSDQLLIGRGGFGKVYKGMIDSGETTVAVKRLRSNSIQGAREFLTEIETLSELRHHNLVSLIGYCNDHGEMILVYDYMASGTLADHLYKVPQESNSSCSLTWKQRLNICIGAARGLDYLHTGHGVIHRDVKASNILLDENFVAKVSDFGLAKHEDRSKSKSHVSTRVWGTKGYLDPHYVSTSKLTRKSDIYSFGVVLLEILCERPPMDSTLPEEEQILTKWARENINKGNIDLIASSSLRDEVSGECLGAFLDIADRCLHDEPTRRPTMVQVVLQLESALEQHDSKQVSRLKSIAHASDGNRGDLSETSGAIAHASDGNRGDLSETSGSIAHASDGSDLSETSGCQQWSKDLQNLTPPLTELVNTLLSLYGYPQSSVTLNTPLHHVYVNDKPLSIKELVTLLSCPNPPKRLRSGKYWYDKISGFWGKDGEKPSQIISANLEVGYQIRQDASNGTTGVLINNREITKAELRMLQIAGIYCEGPTHFWLTADGFYQLEGMNYVMGNLWEKRGVRLTCALLSLPFPSDFAKSTAKTCR